jgi:hypothetical protein
MNKFLKVAGIATLIAVVGIVAVAGFALAQDPTPTPGGRPGLHGGFGWMGPGFGLMGGGDWSTFDAAAQALGLTPEQLFSELHSGKTLSDVAAEKGVDLQTVQDAMAAARKDAVQQAIEQAVTDGKISREQADWMLQGLDNGWLGGRGFRGHGWGHKGLNPGSQVQPQGSRFQGHFFAPGQSL